MNNQQSLPTTEGICPVCQQTMERIKPNVCHCKYCQQSYDEQYLCPKCSAFLQQVKGCGAINYICTKDGLVSSNQVKFHYRPIVGE